MSENNSIPPQEKANVAKLSIITHTIIDMAAIITVALFVIMDKLDSTTGIAIIALIAGVWLNNTNNKNNNGPSGGSSVIIGALTGAYKIILLLGRPNL